MMEADEVAKARRQWTVSFKIDGPDKECSQAQEMLVLMQAAGYITQDIYVCTQE
jgi:hypothetical protein